MWVGALEAGPLYGCSGCGGLTPWENGGTDSPLCDECWAGVPNDRPKLADALAEGAVVMRLGLP